MDLIVLSPRAYNGKIGLALVCPITSQVKHYGFEVAIPTGFAISGVVLVDQIKWLDWESRKAQYACTLPASVVEDTIAKVKTLLT